MNHLRKYQQKIYGCTFEYNLSEVSYILTDPINGLWKFGESFEESINTILKKKQLYFSEQDKEEFIEYARKS